MNIQDHIKRHQDAVKLIEAIEYFRRKKARFVKEIEFMRLTTTREWYEHEIDICTRCIKRLTERYNRLYNPNT